MSLTQCIEGCPQHETRVRHKQRQGRRMRVQEILGKDVRNMKARQMQDLRGGAGGPGGPGVSGGGPGGSRGVYRGGPEVLGGKTAKNTRETLWNCMASRLRSNIQDFVQEVPVGQS